MANLNISRTRDLLQNFEFEKLFIEELGWLQPTSRKINMLNYNNSRLEQKQIAQLSGVVVFEIDSSDDRLPDAKMRALVHKEISRLHHENLLIFIDQKRTQSLWYYVKREGTKKYPRDHYYFKGQPGDLFLSKLSSMVIDMSELEEEGKISVVAVANRLKEALDVERVTKKFYSEFQDEHLAFLQLIQGIDDERDRRWYASIILNRLMFIYFLQRKGFVNNGDLQYLQNKLAESRRRGANRFYTEFLKTLFFEGFAKPEQHRSPETNSLLGNIRYLNGGIFLPHRIETEWPHIKISDHAFDNLFHLFQRYSWNLNDTPGGKDNELNPDVLGYIFEKYINQKAFGAYYTRTEITEYLCEHTIHPLILKRINNPVVPGVLSARQFDSMAELLMSLDARLCRELLIQILPDLHVLDPACGSGAFLVAAMKTLINIYSAIIGKIKFLADPFLIKWLKDIEHEHSNVAYFIKKSIITDNLFGVDIMEEATEIARLRLFLALVASAQSVEQLEPLPNIDFNILSGNSLVGLMRISEDEFDKRKAQSDLFKKSYREVIAEKNRLIDNYRHTAQFAEDLRVLRDNIEHKKTEAIATLNEILLDDFGRLGIKFEVATWDEQQKKQGKKKKRTLKIEDIKALLPFHWGYEFDQLLHQQGGFDVIITNPPWEIFKPNAKEFFEEYSDLVTKKKMNIKDFEKEQAKLLKDAETRTAWLDYLSSYPHLSAYFRSALQYKNQISIVAGKKAGSDINLYKLFTEQCFNLLRNGGCCGIVIPSGIYTDLGTKQLREMLFSQTEISGLFCFENRKEIFEGVHRSYKFLVLTYEKSGKTISFPAAFMRHDVHELQRFPQHGAILISLDLVHRLSPNSLSVMEFKNEMDLQIAEKMLQFPLLGEKIDGKWNLVLGNEFHMTNDSHLFKTEPGKGRLPLYEGKMIWQFEHRLSEPHYWIDEKEGRKSLLGKDKDIGQNLGYQTYRLGHRSIASSTNERTMIATILHPDVFFGHSINATIIEFDANVLMYLTSVLNSYVLDFMLRSNVSANLTMFFIYQLPVPRLIEADATFWPIVERAVKLICTTPEFDDLAKEVGLQGYQDGVTDPAERARLRAELDGLIAYLYGLTETEFAYILTTFPLVAQSVKDAALEAYRTLAPKPIDGEIAELIAKGESSALEFKSSARWDVRENRVNKELEKVIVKTIAAFLNSESGGTLLVGVEDNGVIIGLQNDYKTLGKKQDRDGYENFLTKLLLDTFGKDCSPSIQISFHELEGKDVCRIIARPSPRPVYVKDERGDQLYIRTGNSTRMLSTKEAIEYSKIRWK